MSENNYLQWLAKETPTAWWHDSADKNELRQGLANGATGVTTNPVLVSKTLSSTSGMWSELFEKVSDNLPNAKRTELLLKGVVCNAAELFRPEYERSGGKSGYICAQVNPAIAADTKAMIEMGRRFNSWAPNIAVKFPVTVAGLNALEDCIAEGITITATVSFTVPQVVAVAERHRRGIERAHKGGIKPGRCFAVIMIGRIDDYLRDVAADKKAKITESDIIQAGIAITKRAYSIYKKRGYEARLLVAALRGIYHMEELTGAELTMSIHPTYQAMLLAPGIPREPNRIDVPVASDVIKRLETIPEFVRAYEPEGMKPEEFLTYGVSQRTLTQFLVGGWSRIEALDKH